MLVRVDKITRQARKEEIERAQDNSQTRLSKSRGPVSYFFFLQKHTG